MILHRALHCDGGWSPVLSRPFAWRIRSSRAIAASVAAGGSALCDAPGSTISAARSAAARPKTSRSSSELVPSRVAPCTETQAASPTAISPGTVRSGSPAVGFSTSP